MKIMKPLYFAALLGLGAVSAAQAQRAHLGFRGGYNFDRDDALIGAQVGIPMSSQVELYPSFDYYLTDGGGSMVGFNMDLKLRNVGSPSLYLGGGLSLLRGSSGGDSNTDTGGSLFAGLESRLGATHPFFEVRGVMHDQAAVQLVAGLNFTLY